MAKGFLHNSITLSFFLNIQAEKVENSYGQEDNSLGLWSDCDQVGDRVTVYDGKKTSDPVLIRFCRGNAIPNIVSSGPDMLVVLDTSPFGSPIMATDSANGMELEVSIKFVEQNSLHYAQNSRACKFDIVSNGDGNNKAGYVSNVLHGLSANTTCRYRFQARPTELVWLTFQKFDVIYHKKDIYRSASCLNKLALYDPKTKIRIGEYCENSPPKLCDHSYLQSQNFYSSSNFNSKNQEEGLEFRACVGGNESYISSGNEFTLLETVGESTSVTSLEFVIRYEFIETAQDGSPNSMIDQQQQQSSESLGGFSCHRVFRSDSYSSRLSPQHESTSFAFSTPRNVLFYGRGGKKRLSCSYTFHGKPGERVQLLVNSLKLPQTGGCSSQPLLGQDHYTCQRRGPPGGKGRGFVWLSELPDQRTPLYQHCLCQNVKYQKHAPMVFLSNTSSLRLDFKVDDMTPSEDYKVREQLRRTDG